MTQFAYMVNNSTITIYTSEDGVLTIDRSNPQSAAIIAHLGSGNYTSAVELLDVATQLEEYGKGNVSIEGGEVYLNGAAVHNSLTQRIINMYHNGDDIEAMVIFFENLMQNPSARAVEELYRFLECNSLPITDDGHFIAYKNVNSAYTDRHTGTFDNSVGATCEMPRNQVQDDPNRTCSTGLHFCSMHYLTSMWGTDGHTMVVKINPKDVVSIPVDYENSKGRTCKYVVIDEHMTADTGEDFYPEGTNVYTQEEQELFDEGFDAGKEEGYDDGYSDGYYCGAVDNQD